VERDLLVPIGRSMPRDGLPVLDDPPTQPGAALAEGDKLGGVRKMTSTTRVIGVAINGEARAYPLWIMNWHEIVNDTLGGEPILVTYNGPCDSVAVFDRRIGGRERRFGFSGLVYNGNLLLYDRAEPAETARIMADSQPAAAAGGLQPASHAPSLWSQLQFRAIAGPAAVEGLALTVLPAWLGEWSHWVAAHPDTSIILPQRGRERLYKREPYQTYFANDHLSFPVRPLPAAQPDAAGYRFDLKSRVAGLPGASRADWRVVDGESSDARVVDCDRPRVYALWFAWQAHHGAEVSAP
jgi:hypothetical protein